MLIMKNSKLIFFILVTILFIASSCIKEKDIPPIDYFPNEIGYTWVYNIYDSVAKKSDTLQISIIGSKNIDGSDSKIWLLTYPNKTDTFFVSEKNDTVIFNTGIVRKVYVFPFFVNQIWDEYLASLTRKSEVIGIENISTEAGVFNNTYIISRFLAGYNYYLKEKVYFKPGVGIVKLYSFEYNLSAPEIKTWELKSKNF